MFKSTGQMYQIYDKILNIDHKHFAMANLRGNGSTGRWVYFNGFY
jgi:hypothetical protein